MDNGVAIFHPLRSVVFLRGGKPGTSQGIKALSLALVHGEKKTREANLISEETGLGHCVSKKANASCWGEDTEQTPNPCTFSTGSSSGATGPTWGEGDVNEKGQKSEPGGDGARAEEERRAASAVTWGLVGGAASYLWALCSPPVKWSSWARSYLKFFPPLRLYFFLVLDKVKPWLCPGNQVSDAGQSPGRWHLEWY